VILETPEVNELGRTQARPTVVRSMGEHEAAKATVPATATCRVRDCGDMARDALETT